MQDFISHGQMRTDSVAFNDIQLTSLGDPQWANFLPFLDQQLLDVEIEHETPGIVEVEVGTYRYNHGNLRLERAAAPDADQGVEWSTAGIGVQVSFSAGFKKVSASINARTLRRLILFRGGGRTINQDTDFGATGTFTLSITNDKHRALKVMGFADGVLTDPMTVALPDPDTAQWGDEIYVEKGDTSTHAVTVLGFDNNEIGTHLLTRQGQHITAKLVGATEKRWERTRGGQQSPSAKGQDLVRATDPEIYLLDGPAPLRSATAAQSGKMTAIQAGLVDGLAAAMAYEPENF